MSTVIDPAFQFARHPDNPILSPLPGSDWQSLVTTNPGAWRDAESGIVSLLYRAAGDDEAHRVHYGLALDTLLNHLLRHPVS